MGSIPADFTLDRLVGRQLNQVCIGPYDLQFRFDSEYFISCQGRVVVVLDIESTVVFWGDNPWWGDVAPLPRLAGRDAVSWCVESSHEFSVTLIGEARLHFHSTDCTYEEFVIHPCPQVV